MSEPLFYPEPVEPVLWLTLLVGTGPGLPCRFGADAPWPCNERSYAGRCPDLGDRYTAEDVARHCLEAGSATVACSGPAAFVVDLVDSGGGIVEACVAHDRWLERHAWTDHVGTPTVAIRWGGMGPWALPNYFPERRAEVEAEMGVWREWLGGRALDPSDRSAVALASRLAPEPLRSSGWGRQVGAAARGAERSRRDDGRQG